MPYSTSNPPQMVSGPLVAGSAPSTWVLKTADPSATVDAAGYISNGFSLGMKVGDLLQVHDTVNNIVSSHVVVSVNATTGAVDLSNGTVIGSASNSD